MRFERYDRIVDYYPQHWPLIVPGYLPILNAMLEIVWAYERRPHAVLDLGCGPGSATIAVAPACDPKGSITLVDGSKAMLQAAERVLHTNVREAIFGDFTNPTMEARIFGPHRYDLILSSFALHHLEDVQKAKVISNAAASLMPGGIFLLGDEIATDRPAGFLVIERVRARIIQSQLENSHIMPAFWRLETTLPAELQLPFLPSRLEHLATWMQQSGLAICCPVAIFGSALLVGVKPL